MNWLSRNLTFSAGLFVLFGAVQGADRIGISVAEKANDNSPEAELAGFALADGYEANLFASEIDGIANPIAMHWDPAGRLWVLTTLAYAQLEPGRIPDDQLLILEDTDRDGRVDRTVVWADGLNMPTGFALGHGGVYLAEGEGLFFLSDRDSDGKADHREMLLTGFGTGDTHQNINSLSWGPAGDLWFTQGLHNFSRVETPWGIVRGEEAGFWRLRVPELKLEPFCMGSMASQNPWGVGWDRWGSMFLKSNNTQLGYVSPGIIPTTHYEELMRRATVATTPGKSMGCEIVESSHLPELKDHVLIAGYFANRVTAFPLEQNGAGFKETKGTELLVSSHTSFRPVEVKIGPDGAIYVADWFNPIIGHYQASLRHPDRDIAHGRIWRIARKGRTLVDPPELEKASAGELLQTHLRSPERWVRYQARRRLADLPSEAFADAIKFEPSSLIHVLEVTWARESRQFRVHDDQYVEFMLKNPEAPLRAYGARMIGRWANALSEPERLLELAIADKDPRVRLEAIVSASHLGTPNAQRIALLALDAPRDLFIDYSLVQTTHALSDAWLPALQSGDLSFESSTHLAFAVETLGSSEGIQIVLSLLDKASMVEKRELYLVLAQVGNPDHQRLALEGLPNDLTLLNALADAFRVRPVRPAGNLATLLRPALEADTDAVRAAAVHLAGTWKVGALAAEMVALARDSSVPAQIREAALLAAAAISGAGDEALYVSVISSEAGFSIKNAAIAALAVFDINKAAQLAPQVLSGVQNADQAGAVLAPFLGRANGSKVLAEELATRELPEKAVDHMTQALASLGRSDESLLSVLQEKRGGVITGIAYSAEFVQKLVEEVRISGIAENGKRVYESPLLGCVACHAIEGNGGVLGPQLTTVGAGLPVDLIIEAILWPERQLKEGYFSVSVTTKEGRVFNGYRDREEKGVLWLRDVISGRSEPIRQNQIAHRNDVGTLMPAGLTANLSREELRDLVRYLSELR
ncbi:MAG: PVC-type heme-binding CxxCH protein [Verrucomicrobiota bacterium]